MKSKKKSITRIGLLTPYTGENLGDGAIQEAVIANIRRRFADAEIYGFTLAPGKTANLHKIPCLPITALSIDNYFSGGSATTGEKNITETARRGITANIKSILKKDSLLFQILKKIHHILAGTLSIAAEIRLSLKGYRLLKKSDLLIVAGGGQLDDYWGGPWGQPYNLWKWGIIAKAAGTPYIFLSVGTCSLDSSFSFFFIKRALSLASYRSYRDSRSKALLSKLDFTHLDPVYPDLAFSHDIPVNNDKPASTGRLPVVGISPIAYLSSYFWPEENIKIFKNYLTTLTVFVSSLLQEGCDVILFYTDGPDKFVIKELQERLLQNKSNTSSLTVIETKSVHDLLTLMDGIDYVVVSRLHGAILAHLMQRPVLAISYDKKVTTYMRDALQSDWCLDIHNVQPELLMQTFFSLRANAATTHLTVAAKTAQFRKELARQYDKILELSAAR